MNNADLIVATLKAAGIGHGFGIPSGNVLPLIEAMRQGGIEFVLTAHEGSAGFAADVMGRQTGRPGLGIATLGPGATNLATGVGDAFLDRSPMIAITCNLNRDQLGRRIQMLIDHHTLFRPITKASLALRPGRIGETVAAAIRIALTEPQGPVHLDLPEDVALAPAEEAIPALDAVPAPEAPPADSVEAAAARIAGAKRPVAVIGATAMRLRDPDLLRAVVERHELPFASTTMAKGLIDEDHPLSLGCIERARRQVQRQFLAGADLIVGLGYDTIEVEYEAWIGTVPLVHLDIEAGGYRRQGRHRPSDGGRPRRDPGRAGAGGARLERLDGCRDRRPPRRLPGLAPARRAGVHAAPGHRRRPPGAAGATGSSPSTWAPTPTRSRASGPRTRGGAS